MRSPAHPELSPRVVLTPPGIDRTERRACALVYVDVDVVAECTPWLNGVARSCDVLQHLQSGCQPHTRPPHGIARHMLRALIHVIVPAVQRWQLQFLPKNVVSDGGAVNHQLVTDTALLTSPEPHSVSSS